jgi:hypothetical protein
VMGRYMRKLIEKKYDNLHGGNGNESVPGAGTMYSSGYANINNTISP